MEAEAPAVEPRVISGGEIVVEAPHGPCLLLAAYCGGGGGGGGGAAAAPAAYRLSDGAALGSGGPFPRAVLPAHEAPRLRMRAVEVVEGQVYVGPSLSSSTAEGTRLAR